MPLFYQHIIDEETRLGIWRIEEPEEFFMQKVPVKKDVRHPYKRLQHLAGRYLLPILESDFPLAEIEIADTRKPYLPDAKYHFSISHCGNHAAAIVSRRFRVGIDIELVTPRILSIREKFLNEKELIYLEEFAHLPQLYLQLLTIVWSAKESIYKWYGAGQLDFSRDMILNGPLVTHSNEWVDLPFRFERGNPIPLKIEARIFNALVLAWLKT